MSATPDAGSQMPDSGSWPARKSSRRERISTDGGRKTFLQHLEAGALDMHRPVRQIAAQEGVGPRQLERDFHQAFGHCPRDILRGLLFAKAKRLLRDKVVIKGVAFEMGYKSAEHFTYAFKHHFGITPSEYLAQIRHRGPE